MTLVLLDREIADPDRPLESTLWTVDGLVGNAFVFAAQHGGDATIELADGTATIVTPCAHGTASYEIVDAKLTLRSVAFDDPVCPGDEFSPKYDAHMRDVLVDGALDWKIDVDRLTLMRGDIGLMLRTER